MEVYPLFEHAYDEGRNAMSRPVFKDQCHDFPARCVMSFMKDALLEFVEKNSCKQIATHHSEAGDSPVWEFNQGEKRCALVQSPVGAPSSAILMDLLIASGATRIVSCGGCGVISPIPAGEILVPTSALRDEGTSYHYVAPAREIQIEPAMVKQAEELLKAGNVAFRTCKTWSCDGFFRETPSMVQKRRAEGCDTVDMECSALAAVAQFYGTSYAALLYSGDSLADEHNHDSRDWLSNTVSRFSVLNFAVQLTLAS